MFDSNLYADRGVNGLDLGKELGQGSLLSCNDTGGPTPTAVGALPVFAIKGVDQADAIAVGQSASEAALFIREGKQPPAAVRSLMP